MGTVRGAESCCGVVMDKGAPVVSSEKERSVKQPKVGELRENDFMDCACDQKSDCLEKGDKRERCVLLLERRKRRQVCTKSL